MELACALSLSLSFFSSGPTKEEIFPVFISLRRHLKIGGHVSSYLLYAVWKYRNMRNSLNIKSISTQYRRREWGIFSITRR